MRFTRLLPLLFGLSLSLANSAAFAAAPSGLEWLTLVTPHFRVHHTAPLEAYARAIGRSLERVLPLLEKDLHWQAPAPVDIVVMNPSDSANGFAVNFPNTHVELYAVPFESDSVLTYYVDWADELATHELTHIIANDGGTGFYRTLRSIFGSWVKPNGLQPVWLMEGLAVYTETKHTPGGRGRSPWLEALLAQAVKEGKLDDPTYTSIDRFNDGNPWWPGGSTPYLMGYTIQALGTQAHPNLPGDISINNAGRFPFLPNSNARRTFGESWTNLWRSARARLASRYPALPDAPAPCWLTTAGRATGGQALSPDGWVYYTDEDFQYGVHLARVRADAACGSAKVERLYHKWYGGPTQVAVDDKGARVAFAQNTSQRFERFFSDLHIYHPATGRTEQVTNGKRARDPAFAGDYLLYISNQEDTSQAIVRLDLRTGADKVLFAGKPLERLSGLNARGNTLAFSLHDNKGHEKIRVLNLDGGEPSQVIGQENEGRENERNPQLLPNGELLYAYAHGGRQEIRRAKIGEGKSQFVMEAANGFLDRPIPLPGGKEILVQAYTLEGLNLARLPLPPAPAAESPAPARDLHEFLSAEAPPPLDTAAKAPADFPPSIPYRAASTPATSLWPQYWLPEGSFERGGFLVGASTAGNDPLEYHRYGLLMQYDSRARFPRYRAFYDNREQTTRFHFEASQYNNYFESTKNSNRQAIYSGEAIVPLGGFTFYSFGAAFQERTLFRANTSSLTIFQNFVYDQTGRRPAALESNFGTRLRAYVAAYPNAKNEDFFLEVRPEASFYFRGFAPSHSVSVAARAGVSTNRLLASNYFQGGGLTILSEGQYVVRGYPVDALLGQRIATLNLAYTLPLAWPYRGLGVNPVFLESFGLKFLADAGSANLVADFAGQNFRFYRPSKLFDQTLVGFGAELLARGTLFYHVPVTGSLGVHYGPMQKFGGGVNFFLGLNVGILGLNGTPSIDH